MAEKESIVTLSLGSQRVTMAKFLRGKSGLILQKYGFRQVVTDPSLPEGARMLQLAQGVKDLVAELKLAGSKTWFAVSGKTVFLKFFKLPPVGNVPEAQLVKMEAQQNVPFPIDEVVWDYHIQTTMSGEKEVFLVAIKDDALTELDSLVSHAGLETAGVTPSSIAIYNAFKMSYPDEHASVMVLDIGARNTNVLYIEGETIFIRNIPSGGSAVTAQIAKEYGVSFQDAEANKLEHGMVMLGGGHSTQLDEATAHLASVIRNSLNRLVTQIAQTTNLYRTQGTVTQPLRGDDSSRASGGSAPTQIYLCGGACALPYTKEFLEERLHLPVKYLNPLHHVSVAKELDPNEVASKAYLLAEPVGLAVEGMLNNAANKIMLTPQKLRDAREMQKRLPFLYAGFAAAIIGAGVFAFGMNRDAAKAEQAANQLEVSYNGLTEIRDQLEIKLASLKTLDAQSQHFQHLVRGRYAMLDLINEMREFGATDKLWVTDFAPVVGFDETIKDKLSGSPVIADSFRDIANGATALVVKEQAPTAKKGASSAKQAKNALNLEAINAIRLQGLVRIDNGGTAAGQAAVNQFVEKLKKSLKFKFANLENRQIIQFDQGQEGAYAIPFTIIVPLAQPIEIYPDFDKAK